MISRDSRPRGKYLNPNGAMFTGVFFPLFSKEKGVSMDIFLLYLKKLFDTVSSNRLISEVGKHGIEQDKKQSRL